MQDDARDLADLAGRLKDATKAIGTRKAAAEMAGVSVAQWDRYIGGQASPSWLAISRMAAQSGISLDWLATGIGPMKGAATSIDEELLAEIIHLAEVEADRRGSRPSPEKLAALIVHCYVEELRHVASDGTGRGRSADPAAVRRAFRLVG